MARSERMNADRLARHLHPTVRFFWGLGLLCCLVFSGGWEARTLLAVMGLTLALLSGKRVSFGYFAFLIASVVVFNLFLPLGKLWFQIGPWAVTDGAFFLGLGKAMTFAGLVFFSLASISRHLRLPGRLGSLWGQTFAWYEQLMDQRRALKPRALLMSIDRLLEQLYPTRPGNQVPVRAEEKETRPDRTTVIGWVLVGLTWIPAFIVALVLK